MYIIRVILSYLLAAGLVLLAVFLAIPSFVNVDSYRQPLFERISHYLNMPIQTNKLEISLFPFVGLKIKGIKVSDQNGDFVQTKELEVRLKLKTLLQKEPMVVLSTKHATLHLRQSNDLSWNIQKLLAHIYKRRLQNILKPPAKNLSSLEIEEANGEKKPPTNNTLRSSPQDPFMPPISTFDSRPIERSSIFEKIKLQEIHLENATFKITPFQKITQTIEVHHFSMLVSEEQWVLRFTSDPKAFLMFDKKLDRCSTNEIELLVNRNKIKTLCVLIDQIR